MKKPFRNKVTTRSKTVLINEFKNIVGVANIRRLVLFDAVNGETTLTDKSVNKQNATLSLSAGSLDQAITGKLKALNFNGTGDYWDFEDADDLSFGDGSADSAYSLIACVNPNAVSSGQIIAKLGDETGNTKREYSLGFNSSKLYIRNYDDNINKTIGRTYNTALTADIGSYHTYISTYDASAVSSGLKLYRDSVKIDDTDFATAGYIAMENKTAKVGNYYLTGTATKTAISSCKYAFVAIVSIELTQGQVTAIDTLLRRYSGVL